MADQLRPYRTREQYLPALDFITGNKGDGTEQKSVHEYDEKRADLGSF